MLSNYIKIAIRNIVRHKLYSIINIMGLAIGMACAILLLLFVRDELTYDRHNSQYDRIYMVNSHLKQGELDEYIIGSSFPMGEALKDEYPVIEESVDTYRTDRLYFIDQERAVIGEDNICYTDDPEIFNVFDHEFIYGSPEGALDNPNSIVLSETLARKYFGEQNPVGKTLSRNDGVDYIVKGIFKDLPLNTFRRYTALISPPAREDIEGIDSRKSEFFFDITDRLFTYILLSENASIESITNDYERFRKKYISEHGKKNNGDFEPVFQSLSDVYLYSAMVGPLPWYLFVVYLGSSLSLLILIIACINYINIATASSWSRAREVGVRKALGADRATLIRQFLCESIVITILSLFVALALVELALPTFNSQTGKEIAFSVFGEPAVFTSLIAITLIVAMGAGSHPAFFLSSLQTASVVKGNPRAGTGRGRLRKLLVVTQFSIAIILITLSLLFRQGLVYLKTMDLGFNMDNIMVISPQNDQSTASLENLKKELLVNTDISAVARSNDTAGDSVNRWLYRIEDKKGELVEKTGYYLLADSDFINLMGMVIKEGRSFNMDVGADRNSALLVNETLVKEMGWADSPIGKRIQCVFNERKIDGIVIGVIKDFTFIPFYKVEPIVIVPGENNAIDKNRLDLLSIKIRPENSEDTIEFIRKKWVELNPSYPFEYGFLKDFISDEIRTADKMSRTLIYFALLGIFISCLGLFGLSSFVAERKAKEIGIRKVFGASVGDVVFKLSFDFLKLILISCIIAHPIAHYAMTKWAELFPDEGDVSSWHLYVISTCIALIIAFITISYHAAKAALTDPVKALRYE